MRHLEINPDVLVSPHGTPRAGEDPPDDPIEEAKWRLDNPNKMEEERYDLLVEAINRVGFLQPVLAREMEDGVIEIVDGHHRVQAARQVGLPTIPVVVIEKDDPAWKAAVGLQIGMNQLRGELDLSIVGRNLVDLVNEGWDEDALALTGFTTEEIADLINAVTDDGTSNVLDDIGSLPETTDDPAPRPFVIEVEFGNKEQYQKCRKALRRAAGKGGELSDGLLVLIGEQ